MRNDAELLRAANAQWAVVPLTGEVCCWVDASHSNQSAGVVVVHGLASFPRTVETMLINLIFVLAPV